MRTVYLNGNYIPEDQATVSIFDRGLLFGDGVYEVAGVLDGKLLDFSSHMARLMRSLEEMDIAPPLSEDEILVAFREMVRLNDISEGLVYMQITRGVAERDFAYADNIQPTVFMFTQTKPKSEDEKVAAGVALHSVVDIRWARRDIKSVNLLGQVLAKQEASKAGAYEALLVGHDGYITECGSTSFFIYKDNTIITRPLSNDILPGITRKAVIELCAQNNIELVERHFTLEEAYAAEEAFISGASTYVLAVSRIDDHTIGLGIAGNMAVQLRAIYIEHARQTAI